MASVRGSALLMSVALLVVGFAANPAAALTKTILVPFNSSWWNGGWACGGFLPILHTGTYTTSFDGTLPLGSKVTKVTINAPMRRAGTFYYIGDTDPTVSYSMNGLPVGSPAMVSGYLQCPYPTDLTPYAFQQAIDTSTGAYNAAGFNTLTISVTGGTCPNWCGVTVDNQVSVIVEYTPGYEVTIQAGDGQTGATTGPLAQPLRVRLTTPETPPQYAGKKVVFTVKQSPGSGTTVGADELATTQTYTATADALGYADGVLVLGNKAGTYTVEASSPLSVTNSPATFTATAQKPDKVVISRNQPDPAYAKSTFAVSVLQEPTFYAVGLNANNVAIGRIKCSWNADGKGKGAGAATLTPSAATLASAVTFTPTDLGKVTLSANPTLGGLSTTKSSVLIGGIYLQVGDTFDPMSDDAARFLPGSDVYGQSLKVPTPADGSKEIQTVTLHLITDPVTKGKVTDTVTYELKNVSNYPGIAMNWPVTNPGTGKDLDFGDGLQSTPAITLDPSGDTKTLLKVYDYAASGVVLATVKSSKKTYTIELPLPMDEDHNGLPDAGWSGNGIHIDTTGMSAAQDVDDQPPGQTGDGLSNFEEYRGFVVATSHRRTNPRKRDVFIAADPSLLVGTIPLVTITKTLPFQQQYVDLTEIAGEDWTPRGIIKGKAIVNPNRAGVPGALADGQRAVRLIYQKQYPSFYRVTVAPGTTEDVDASKVLLFGATVLDTTDPDLINTKVDGTLITQQSAESPDTTRWSEVYESSFTNAGIAMASNNIVYQDANGSSIPPCTGYPGEVCDSYDYLHHLVLPQKYPGGIFELHSVPYEGDWYTKRAYTCGNPYELVDYGFTEAEMGAARVIVGAHEMGHALHVDHTTICGNLMLHALYPAGEERDMFDIQPLPIFYSSDEIDQMKLHP